MRTLLKSFVIILEREMEMVGVRVTCTGMEIGGIGIELQPWLDAYVL
jgi:hypothetical protein